MTDRDAFKIHPERVSPEVRTGIFVRAQLPDGGWTSADIGRLDAASLLSWLQSDGEENRLAENVVGILLGHGRLHPDPPAEVEPTPPPSLSDLCTEEAPIAGDAFAPIKRYTHYVRVPFAGYFVAVIESDSKTLSAEQIADLVDIDTLEGGSGASVAEWSTFGRLAAGAGTFYGPLNEAVIDYSEDREQP